MDPQDAYNAYDAPNRFSLKLWGWDDAPGYQNGNRHNAYYICWNHAEPGAHPATLRRWGAPWFHLGSVPHWESPCRPYFSPQPHASGNGGTATIDGYSLMAKLYPYPDPTG